MIGRRVLLVGTTGSGKTTLAVRLAERLGVPHVELDALHHGPEWQELSEDELRAAVTAALAAAPDGWVVDGNHRAVRDILLSQADTVLWLDYARPLVMWRVVRRSVGRALFRRELWNGNREGFRDWRDPRHPVRWAWTSHPWRRAEYGTMAAGDPRWVRLRRPRQLERRFSRA